MLLTKHDVYVRSPQMATCICQNMLQSLPYFYIDIHQCNMFK